MAQKNQSLAGVENDKRSKDQEGLPVSMLAAKENSGKFGPAAQSSRKCSDKGHGKSGGNLFIIL